MNPSLAWLYSLQHFGIKPGLENTRRMLKELQLPGPRQKFLHVAGTNGKGSTCAFMESILRRAGERTGLFTSPQDRKSTRLNSSHSQISYAVFCLKKKKNKKK